MERQGSRSWVLIIWKFFARNGSKIVHLPFKPAESHFPSILVSFAFETELQNMYKTGEYLSDRTIRKVPKSLCYCSNERQYHFLCIVSRSFEHSSYFWPYRYADEPRPSFIFEVFYCLTLSWRRLLDLLKEQIYRCQNASRIWVRTLKDLLPILSA